MDKYLDKICKVCYIEIIALLLKQEKFREVNVLYTWLKPKLLLLDEHTAALDPKSAAKVAELTKQIIDQEKLTALMVTHSMQQAVDLSDRIVMMHQGRIIEDYQDEMKKRIRVHDLIDTFDRVQKRELFDDSVAELLFEQYV